MRYSQRERLKPLNAERTKIKDHESIKIKRFKKRSLFNEKARVCKSLYERIKRMFDT